MGRSETVASGNAEWLEEPSFLVSCSKCDHGNGTSSPDECSFKLAVCEKMELFLIYRLIVVSARRKGGTEGLEPLARYSHFKPTCNEARTILVGINCDV